MTDLPLIVEPETLESLLDDDNLLIVDLCHPERYSQGHIPGAVYVHPQETQSGRAPSPGLMPDREALQALVNRIGLTPDRHVVVYDDEGGGWAGRFIWLLDGIGHQHYSYLNGGWIAWDSEGRPLTAEIPEVAPSHYPLHLTDEPTATLDDILTHLGQEDQVIWDARSAAEFHGQRQTAAKSGHIPGARHFEWTQAMDPAHDFRLKPEPLLRKQLDALGITPDKTVITHCQTHHRSGLTYLVAKTLGYPRIKGYAGSWAEWGNHPDTPVEK